jgi:hypothetical protein
MKVEPRSLGEPRGDGREAVVLCRAGALLLFPLARAWVESGLASAAAAGSRLLF